MDFVEIIIFIIWFIFYVLGKGGKRVDEVDVSVFGIIVICNIVFIKN